MLAGSKFGMLVMPMMVAVQGMETTATYHLQYTSNTHVEVRHTACLDYLAGWGLPGIEAMEKGGRIIEGMNFHFTASSLGGEYDCGACLEVTGAIGTVYVTVVDHGGSMLDLTATMYEQAIGPLSGPAAVSVNVVSKDRCPGSYTAGGPTSPAGPAPAPIDPPASPQEPVHSHHYPHHYPHHHYYHHRPHHRRHYWYMGW